MQGKVIFQPLQRQARKTWAPNIWAQNSSEEEDGAKSDICLWRISQSCCMRNSYKGDEKNGNLSIN
jgi:hypothetical protein